MSPANFLIIGHLCILIGAVEHLWVWYAIGGGWLIGGGAILLFPRLLK